MQGPSSVGDTGPVEVEPIHTGRVLTISIIAALGGFLFGYDSSVINGANKAVFYQFQIANGFYQGFVVAIALLGSALGAFIGGPIAARYGRKKVMVVAAIMFLIAGIGTAFPFSVYDFMFWRVIGGIGIGLAAVVSPMYISEVAPAHLRGRLSSLFQLAIVIGIFATQLVNQVIINLTPDTPTQPMLNPDVPPQEANNVLALNLEAWQWMFICMVVPAIIYWVLSLTLPESPRYLVNVIPRSAWPDGVPPVMGGHLLASGVAAPLSVSKGEREGGKRWGERGDGGYPGGAGLACAPSKKKRPLLPPPGRAARCAFPCRRPYRSSMQASVRSMSGAVELARCRPRHKSSDTTLGPPYKKNPHFFDLSLRSSPVLSLRRRRPGRLPARRPLPRRRHLHGRRRLPPVRHRARLARRPGGRPGGRGQGGGGRRD